MSNILTCDGKWIDTFNLQPEDISLEQIAHHLALTNRWCGATRVPITVAQHAVFVSRLVPHKKALAALHHDDHEAFQGDIPRLVKSSPEYKFQRDVGRRAQQVIAQVFRFNPNHNPEQDEEIMKADNLMLRFEAYMYCHHNMRNYLQTDVSFSELHSIGAFWVWPWERAQEEFIKRGKELCADISTE